MFKCCLVVGGLLVVPGLMATKPIYAAAVETEAALGEQLYWAAKNGQLAEVQDVVRRMRAGGFEINSASYNGLRPLNIAAITGPIDVLQYLMAAGMDVNTPEVGGRTPLVDAVQGGNRAAVKCLIEGKATITPLIQNMAEANLAESKTLMGAEQQRMDVGSGSQDSLDEYKIMVAEAQSLLEYFASVAAQH